MHLASERCRLRMGADMKVPHGPGSRLCRRPRLLPSRHGPALREMASPGRACSHMGGICRRQLDHESGGWAGHWSTRFISMPGSWNKRWCLFAPVDLRGPLPIELRDEAAAPGDGIVAEPVPHRIHRLVDLACPSHLFHPSQKPWNFASPPDTLSGMHKIIEIFADRAALHTEILALRQQVAVLKRKRPRPSLRKADRVFWVILSCLWPGWRHALVIVRPETVIGWHRKGFRLFWTWKSRRGKPGRPPVSREIRHLVRRMSRENTRWGAPRIHGELLKLGFSISQAAVSKYMVRYPSPPSQSWRTFLTNHADCLASIDFFVVPTATFHLLFGFIVLHHERRQIDAFRCHGEPDDGVGRTADPRGIPVGHGAAVPDPRPGRRIRAIVPLDRDGDGRGRGRYGATEPVAKSVCGTPDRQREARMPGPFDHPQRAAFAAHSWLIPRLLSRFKDPLVARQGHTGWTTRSAGRVRNGRFLAQGRRSASSLRTPRGLTTRARIRSIPLCGDVDAAGIRMPLHRFAGTIRRNKHRDDRAHGRLQNPLAQNDVRAGEPSRRWEARWNKWKGQRICAASKAGSVRS